MQFLNLEKDQVFMLSRKRQRLSTTAQKVENTMLLKLLTLMPRKDYFLISKSMMNGLHLLYHTMMILMLRLGLVKFKAIQIVLHRQSNRKQILLRRQLNILRRVKQQILHLELQHVCVPQSYVKIVPRFHSVYQKMQ